MFNVVLLSDPWRDILLLYVILHVFSLIILMHCPIYLHILCPQFCCFWRHERNFVVVRLSCVENISSPFCSEQTFIKFLFPIFGSSSLAKCDNVFWLAAPHLRCDWPAAACQSNLTLEPGLLPAISAQLSRGPASRNMPWYSPSRPLSRRELPARCQKYFRSKRPKIFDRSGATIWRFGVRALGRCGAAVVTSALGRQLRLAAWPDPPRHGRCSWPEVAHSALHSLGIFQHSVE